MVFTDDKLFYGIGPEVQSTDALKFLAEIIAAQSK